MIKPFSIQIIFNLLYDENHYLKTNYLQNLMYQLILYQMKNRTPISEIMSTNLITLGVFDTIETAEKLFKKHRIRHIPVVNNSEIVGMLSYSDLLRISFADVTNNEENVDAYVYNMFTIQQLMAKNLTVVTPEVTIKDVAQIFVEKEFHALPVVQEGVLEGIITTTDLSMYLMKQLS